MKEHFSNLANSAGRKSNTVSVPFYCARTRRQRYMVRKIQLIAAAISYYRHLSCMHLNVQLLQLQRQMASMQGFSEALHHEVAIPGKDEGGKKKS